MKSRIKTEGVPRFVDDRSMWDEPFRPKDLRGLAKDMERQDAIARRLRLALPLEKHWQKPLCSVTRKRAEGASAENQHSQAML